MRQNSRTLTLGPTVLQRWPLSLARDADKDNRGRVFVVGGTPRMPGPAILAAVGALRAGAGKLQVGVPASILLHVATAIPEALVVPLEEREGEVLPSAAREIAEHANAADALVLGPGMSKQQTCELACALYPELGVPAVIDAGALTACTSIGDFHGAAILTPHAGEMAAILGVARSQVENEPERCARDAAVQLNAVVALKGMHTYIAAPGGTCLINRSGHVGLATSGSGDALAGIIGGILARGVEPLGAAAWGVYLHAMAGRALASRMGIGFLAHELLAEVPPVMKRLSRSR